MSKILKNVVSLISGQFLVLIINFISITLAARYLGVENFGKFAALLALVTIISKLYDFGFAPIVFRELSKKKEQFYLLNTSILLSISLFAIVIIVTNIVLFLIDFTSNEIILFNIMLINTLFSVKFVSMRELLSVPFKADQLMQLPMSIAVLDNIIFMVLILIMPLVNGGLTYFIVSYFISNVPGFILMLYVLVKKYNFRIKFNLKSYFWLLKESLPIYGFIVLDILYQQIDILLLGGYYTHFEVGVYSASMRLVFPLLIIPSSIVQSVFPIISKNSGSGILTNSAIIKITYKLLIFIAIYFATTFYFKSQDIIILTFGNDYVDGHITTRLLYISQIFFYLNFFTLNLFIAYKKQKWNFWYAILILAVNVIVDLILIPKLSYEGVGFAKILTNLVGFLFLGFLYKRIFNHFYFVDLRALGVIVLFILIMFFISYLSLFPYLLLSIIVSVILIFIMKYFTHEEIRLILMAISKEGWLKRIEKYI